MDAPFIHESSYIDDGVTIGARVKIWHFCHLLNGTTIGADSIIGQNCMIGPHVSVGTGCKLQNNVSLYNGVTLEDDVFCGPSCVFTNVTNPRSFVNRRSEFKSTLVKKGASIGANATILCGITIGRFALIAAGAVVNKDVKDYAIVMGVPGRQHGWVCECGVTLHKSTADQFTCPQCAKNYLLLDDTLSPQISE